MGGAACSGIAVALPPLSAAGVRCVNEPLTGAVMSKYLMMLLVLFSVAAVNVGCRAEGEVDDDGVELDVDN